MRTSNWVLLLRGINIGGAHLLPMRDLVSILESLGLEGVRTYIQSGNVVFRSTQPVAAGLAGAVANEIESRRGFRPQVLLLSKQQLADAVASNPFPEAEDKPKSLHLYFLVSRAEEPDFDSLNAVRAPNERFVLTDGVFYLHTPQGIGRSKLAASVEKLLGVRTTARNWRTVQNLWEIVRED
jgi:uncharacterized protein (DUF1697 family)